ncbi:MAG: GNAT family N-acetyltransferase [Saprospiraceae bacterium]|nr:GNAT family N-acetyltransferase [Saprospiraceae bacterium]
MNYLKIRQATLADLPKLLEFEQGIIATERPFNPTLKDGSINYYDLGAFILSDDAEVVVAELAGEVIASGYAQVRKAQDYLQHSVYAHLGAMFVQAAHRGKGINAEIIHTLIAWAKTRGITEFRLEVYSDNLPAQKAYEKLGFQAHLLEMRLGIA